MFSCQQAVAYDTMTLPVALQTKYLLICFSAALPLQCNTFLGTVTYMSPERINNLPYSFAADIWSLGLALIECATGKYPYDATVGPLQLMFQVLNEDVPIPTGPELSDEFKDFVRVCMQKDPYQRPSAEQLLTHPFILKVSCTDTTWLHMIRLQVVAICYMFHYLSYCMSDSRHTY